MTDQNKASSLFQPLNLRETTLENRIVVAPMCQYSATDGTPNDWHLMHIGNLAISGAGMVIMEATGVSAEGRITPYCLGLYNETQAEQFRRIVEFAHQHSHAKMVLQLSHAGRKGSAMPPWAGRKFIAVDDGGWTQYAPSAIPLAEGLPAPTELTPEQIKQIKLDFVASAERASAAGFDGLEIHAAHGYLLHQFLSPLTNQRTDQYGGSLENRMRLTLEVFDAVRAVWPSTKPLGVRLSATDHLEEGWDIEQTVAICHELKQRHVDWVDVSSSGLSPAAKVDVHPGYQVPFAERVKAETGITTMAVGMITEPQQAEDILNNQQADLIAMAREFLYNPRWPWHAAAELGGQVHYPDQYLRCRPWVRNDVFGEKGSALRETQSN